MKNLFENSKTRSIILIAAMGVLALVSAFVGLQSVDFFSAKAMTDDIVISSDVMVSLLPDASPIFDISEESATYPFEINRLNGDNEQSPMVSNDMTQSFNADKMGINTNVQKNAIDVLGVTESSFTSGENNTLTEGDTIYYYFTNANRYHPDYDNIKVYLADESGTKVCDIKWYYFRIGYSNTSKSSSVGVDFKVPTGYSDRAYKVVISIPYISITEDAHVVQVGCSSSGANFSVSVVSTDDTDILRSKVYTDNTAKYTTVGFTNFYSFEGTVIKWSLNSTYNKLSHITTVTAYTKDSDGNFTVEADCITTEMTDGKISAFKLTMPYEDVYIKVDVQADMPKLRVEITDENRLLYSASIINYMEGSTSTSGAYCYTNELKSNNNITISRKTESYADEKYCYISEEDRNKGYKPLVYLNCDYGGISAKGKIEDPYTVTASAYKMNADGTEGEEIPDFTAYSATGLTGKAYYESNARHIKLTGDIYDYYNQESIGVIVKIKIDFINKPHTLYVHQSKTGGSSDAKYLYFKTDGVAFKSGSETSYATMNLGGINCYYKESANAQYFSKTEIGMVLYTHYIYNTSVSWARPKSIHIYKADENGNAIKSECIDSKLGFVMPEDMEYINGNAYYLNGQTITMPDYDVAIEVECDIAYTPIRLTQIIDDETVTADMYEQFQILYSDDDSENCYNRRNQTIIGADDLIGSTVTAKASAATTYTDFYTNKCQGQKKMYFDVTCPDGYAVLSVHLYYGTTLVLVYDSSTDDLIGFSSDAFKSMKKTDDGWSFTTSSSHYGYNFVVTYGRAVEMTISQELTGVEEGSVGNDTKIASLTVESIDVEYPFFNVYDGYNGTTEKAGYYQSVQYDLKGQKFDTTLNMVEAKPRFKIHTQDGYTLSSVKVTVDGEEKPVKITYIGLASTTVEFTDSDYTIPLSSKVKVDITYQRTSKLIARILVEGSDGTLKQCADEAEVTISVKDNNDTPQQAPFQSISENDVVPSFKFSNEVVKYYVSGTQELQIDTTVKAAGYVIANVDVANIISGDQRGSSIDSLTTKQISYDGITSDNTESHDFSTCYYTLNGGADVYITVIIAKTASVTVTLNARGDGVSDTFHQLTDEDKITAYVSLMYNDSGKYLGYRFNSAKGYYPIIITYNDKDSFEEYKYNVYDYYISESVSTRTVDVLEQLEISGKYSLPEGYFISSISYTCTDGSDTINEGYRINTTKYNGETKGTFYGNEKLKRGCSYNISINIEKAAKVKMEAFYLDDDGNPVSIANRKSCKNILYGERTSENPMYASVMPFLGRISTSTAQNTNTDQVENNINSASASYYVLRNTEFKLVAKPVSGESVQSVQIYYDDDDSNKLILDDYDSKENGEWTYNLSEKTFSGGKAVRPEMNKTMVIKVIYSGSRRGNFKVKMQTYDDALKLGESAVMTIKSSNSIYKNPLVYNDTEDLFNTEKLFTTESSVQSKAFSMMTGTDANVSLTLNKNWIVDHKTVTINKTYGTSETSTQKFSSSEVFDKEQYFAEDAESVDICFTLIPTAAINVYERRNYDGYENNSYRGTIIVSGRNESFGVGKSIYYSKKGFVGYSDKCDAFTNSYFLNGTVPAISVKPYNGYTVNKIELYEQDNLIKTVLASEMTDNSGTLSYEFSDVLTKQIGENKESGYSFVVYYDAVYVKISRKCYDQYGRNNGGCYGSITSTYSSDHLLSDSSSGVMGFVNNTNPTIKLNIPSGHTITEMSVGKSESTLVDVKDIFDYTALSAGTAEIALAGLFGVDKLSISEGSNTYYISYKLRKDYVPPQEKPKPSPKEARVQVHVLESDPDVNDGAYRASNAYNVSLSYGRNKSDYPIAVYESPDDPRVVPDGEVNSVSLPYSFKNGNISSDIYVFIPIVYDNNGNASSKNTFSYKIQSMREHYIFRGAKWTAGSSVSYKDSLNSSFYDLNTGDYSLDLYFSKPIINIQTNNSAYQPKGSISLKENESEIKSLNSDIWNMEFVFNSGTNLSAVIEPEPDYRVSAVYTGTKVGEYKSVNLEDTNVITKGEEREDGTVPITVNLGNCSQDEYLRVDFAKITQLHYSAVNLSQYLRDNDDNSLSLCDTGVVTLTSNQDGSFTYDGAEGLNQVELKDKSSLSAEVSTGTLISVSIKKPSNKAIEGTIVEVISADGATSKKVYSGDNFTLEQSVQDDDSINISVVYSDGYKLIYYENSDNVSGIPPIDSSTYFTGDKATVQGAGTLKKQYYTFKGWSTRSGEDNTEANYPDDFYGAGSEITFANSDIELYAVWEPSSKFTVIYDGNGSTEGEAPVDANSPYYGGSKVTVLDGNALTKTNYTFLGWSRNSSATEEEYVKGNVFEIEQNTTLYAVWQENAKYTVTYKDSLNDEFSSTESYYDGTSFTVKSYSDFSLSHTGYVFGGWSVEPSNKGYSATAGASNTIKEDVVYTAQWTADNYKVIYLSADDGEIASQSHAYLSEVTVGSGVTAPEITGKSFKEWQLIEGGAVIAGGKFSMPANDVKFKAVYTDNEYTITYQLTGSVPDGITAPIDSTAYHYCDNATVKPVPSGYDTSRYVFSGWSTSDVTITDGGFTMPAKNVTITGKFTENNKVNLIYNANGGTPENAVPDNESAYTKLITKVKALSTSFGKTGYSFTGWNTAADGSGVDYKANESLTLTVDLTLYAKWEKDNFNVEYYPETGSTPIATRAYAYESEVTVGSGVTAPTITGKSFKEWQLVSDNVTISEGKFSMPAETVKLRAVYTANEYHVTYQLDGDVPSGITAPTDTNSYHYGDTVNLKAKPSGYNTNQYGFTGWSIDGSEVSVSFTMPAENVTVKGIFSLKDKVYLFYNANGGSPTDAVPATESDYTQLDTTVKAADTGFGKTGYSFTGWCTSANGVGTSYAVGDDISITSDTTLYAQWSINSYAVEYYNEAGTDLIGSKSYDYKANVTVGEGVTAPEITGKSFKEWQLIEGGAVIAGDKFSMPANDVKFKAVYADNEYTITYQLTGSVPDGITAPIDSTAYHYGDNATVKPVPSGYDTSRYVFSGWSTTDVTITAGGFTMPAKNVTLIGTFTENNKVNLIYNANGGTPADSVPDSESAYTQLETTVKAAGADFGRTGYSFTGWNTAANGSGTAYAAGDAISITSDTTLYAQWSVNSYKVKYYDEAGTALIGSKSYAYKANATVGEDVTAPTAAGKSFAGWQLIDSSQTDANDAAIGIRTTFPMPAGDVSYRAVYTANEYHVNYSVSGNIPSGYTAPIDDTVYHMGDTVNVKTAPTAEGYTFTGWSYNSANYAEGTAKSTITMPAGDVELTGTWVKNPAPESKTITYIDSEGNKLAEDSVTAGEDYTVRGYTWSLPNGKTFRSWVVVDNQITSSNLINSMIAFFTSSSISKGDTFNGGDVISDLSDSITLQTQWDDIEYHVTYDANGGDGTAPIDSTAYHYGDTTAAKPHGDLSMTGKVFSHWNTHPNDNGTSYAEGAEITVYYDITLYAIWKSEPTPTIPDTYVVRYDGNGNTDGTAPAAHEYNVGDSVAVEDKGDLTRTGYTFKEWNTMSNGKGTAYHTGDAFTMPASDVTLYAIWVDGNGYIPSPGTGEGLLDYIAAFCAMIIAAVTAGGVIAINRRKRKTA